LVGDGDWLVAADEPELEAGPCTFPHALNKISASAPTPVATFNFDVSKTFVVM
jgi:hypothetical protein